MFKDATKDYKAAGTIPWEYKGLGFWRSFWLNWVEIVISPGGFFSRMPRNVAVAAPLFFFVVCFCLYLVSQVLLSFLQPQPDIAETIRNELFFGFPALLAVVFLTSFILFLFLLLFGVKNVWQNVFRVVCYIDASIMLFGIVPFLGMPVAVIWGFVLLVIAVRKVFQLSRLKSILVCFISFAAFVGIACGVFALIFKLAGWQLPVSRG